MKVGIITFQRADNFGAALQCWALQTYLENQGYDVRVLDYRCKSIELVYSILNIRILFSRRNIFKAFVTYWFNICNYSEMYQKHDEYKKFRMVYLHLTESFSKIEDNIGMDAYIAGSDQIWNFSLLHGFDSNYFLNFPKSKNALKISYAASSEFTAFNEFNKYKDLLSKSLNDFDSISVREDNLKEELRKYTNKSISVCIDPTFLLEKERYEKILEIPKERKYVLIYHMSETTDAVKLAEHIAKEKGLKVIEIHASFNSSKGGRHKRNLGPLQILGYIKYADTVITNSFHGAALSIILKKDLWVINKYKSARLINLLSLAGLTSRYIQTLEEYEENQIDYTKVQENMYQSIENSKTFLIRSLSKHNL